MISKHLARIPLELEGPDEPQPSDPELDSVNVDQFKKDMMNAIQSVLKMPLPQLMSINRHSMLTAIVPPPRKVELHDELRFYKGK
jgi:hypothetical protein